MSAAVQAALIPHFVRSLPVRKYFIAVVREIQAARFYPRKKCRSRSLVPLSQSSKLGKQMCNKVVVHRWKMSALDQKTYKERGIEAFRAFMLPRSAFRIKSADPSHYVGQPASQPHSLSIWKPPLYYGNMKRRQSIMFDLHEWCSGCHACTLPFHFAKREREKMNGEKIGRKENLQHCRPRFFPQTSPRKREKNKAENRPLTSRRIWIEKNETCLTSKSQHSWTAAMTARTTRDIMSHKTHNDILTKPPHLKFAELFLSTWH